MRTIQRYIITGAPGTGKSSLLQELKKKGFCCFSEVSRNIIKEQQSTNGSLFPWKNLSGFAEECFFRMTIQLVQANLGINFYDRAIPDIVAYLKSENLKVPNSYSKNIYKYNTVVFYLPLWKEIYKNDAQRPESFYTAKKLDKYLRDTYTDFGFTLLEIPKTTVNKRVAFVKHFLEKNTIS